MPRKKLKPKILFEKESKKKYKLKTNKSLNSYKNKWIKSTMNKCKNKLSWLNKKWIKKWNKKCKSSKQLFWIFRSQYNKSKLVLSKKKKKVKNLIFSNRLIKNHIIFKNNIKSDLVVDRFNKSNQILILVFQVGC